MFILQKIIKITEQKDKNMLNTLEPFMLTANMLQTSIKYKIENDNLTNEKTKLSCSSVPTVKTPKLTMGFLR